MLTCNSFYVIDLDGPGERPRGRLTRRLVSGWQLNMEALFLELLPYPLEPLIL